MKAFFKRVTEHLSVKLVLAYFGGFFGGIALCAMILAVGTDLKLNYEAVVLWSNCALLLTPALVIGFCVVEAVYKAATNQPVEPIV